MLREGQARALGQAAGYVWEGGKPFYGTRVGPGWYQTGTRVGRGRKLPFSVLRMLMQVTRQPAPCDLPATCKPWRRRRFPSGQLAYSWRTASEYLVGTYRVPSEYLSGT